MIEFIDSFNGALGLLSGLGLVLAGGVAAYFIIRSQMTKFLQTEVDAYKDAVTRMTQEIERLKVLVTDLSKDNQGLVNERDYLRGLIVSALTTQDTVQKNILQDAIKELNKKEAK